jgi:hypothetical protein
MTATSIRPQPAAVVFFIRSLLKQEFTILIEEHDRKSAVERAADMGFHFLHGANSVVCFID